MENEAKLIKLVIIKYRYICETHLSHNTSVDKCISDTILRYLVMYKMLEGFNFYFYFSQTSTFLDQLMIWIQIFKILANVFITD